MAELKEFIESTMVNVLVGVLVIVVPILTAHVKKFLQSKSLDYNKIEQLAANAVMAAEQMATDKCSKITGGGDAKFEYAKDQLITAGVPENLATVFIESAVAAMNSISEKIES